MAISDWPEAERPREKLLERGANALSDAELLAVFLRTGVRGQTAVDMARILLRQYGGLRALLDADMRDLCRAKGLGKTKYVTLAAALELGRRYLAANLQRDAALNSAQAAREYLHAKMRAYDREVFACLYLDQQHRVIALEELFFGTLTEAQVHPREIVKAALKHNAAAVILAHNHPSGHAEPSQDDQAITAQVWEALALVDVRVLDHIIIGDTVTVSLAERGLLAKA